MQRLQGIFFPVVVPPLRQLYFVVCKKCNAVLEEAADDVLARYPAFQTGRWSRLSLMMWTAGGWHCLPMDMVSIKVACRIRALLEAGLRSKVQDPHFLCFGKLPLKPYFQ